MQDYCILNLKERLAKSVAKLLLLNDISLYLEPMTTKVYTCSMQVIRSMLKTKRHLVAIKHFTLRTNVLISNSFSVDENFLNLLSYQYLKY